MFKKIKEFFTGKPAEVVAEVPYKVEVASAPVAEVAPAPVAEVAKATAPAKKAKAPAKKAPAAKKPRAPKAPK
jgi:hypothetical protein